MKHFKKGFLVIFIMATLVVAHFQLRESSPLYNLFFSPSDLYNNLAESAFDLTERGFTKKLEVNHIYPGNHWVALLVEKPAELFEKYDSDFNVQITITSKNKVVLDNTVSNSSSWFLGQKDRSGFSLLTYKISDIAPIGTSLSFTVKVLKPSSEFTKKYGKQRIIISKYSDE